MYWAQKFQTETRTGLDTRANLSGVTILLLDPVRLLKNFSDLYAYSFWKVGHPVLLFQTVRLLEALE